MVDKSIIEQRKKVYGSNFEDISIKWENHLKSKGINALITPKDVYEMMALMKECRVKKGNEILNLMLENNADNFEVNKMCESIEDSQTDRDNYRFIANNWEWYDEI